MELTMNNGIGIVGVHTARLFDVSSKKAKMIERELLDASEKKDAEKYKYYMRAFVKLFLEKELVQKNLIVARGRHVIADRLGGLNTYDGNIDYGAVGTGTTSPAAADTQLGAEVFRKLPNITDTSDVVNGNVSFSYYYSTTDFTNSAIKEFGTFIEGTASANSGRLFSRVLFTETINKTANKTLTVDSAYAITSG